MLDNLNSLINSMKFRIESVLLFDSLPTMYKLMKVVLLILFGFPFAIANLFGFLCALGMCIPFFGIIFIPGGFICDIIGSITFFVIMLPHLLVKNN